MKSGELFDIALLVVTAICIVLAFATVTSPLNFLAGIFFGSSLTMTIRRIYKNTKHGAD